MGRKIKFDKNCGSKFITIDDEKKWELIREIATVKRYESSFNAIVNDALGVRTSRTAQKAVRQGTA